MSENIKIQIKPKNNKKPKNNNQKQKQKAAKQLNQTSLNKMMKRLNVSGSAYKVKKSKMLMSKKNLMARYEAFKQSYARSIILPEFSRNAKLPSIFPQPTASMHKHITIPITTNNTGKAAIVWQPYLLTDSSGFPQSGLYLNNANTLTLSTPEVTTGYQTLPLGFGLSANVYSSYRLVSASIRIDPQMSLQTAQGTIGGGIAVYANQSGASTPGVNQFLFNGDLTVASIVDNLLYFNKANITEQQSIRHIFFPLDPTYEFYTPVNYPHGYSQSTTENNTEFYFAYYITGAPASSSFNLELYMNFECIPTPYAEGYIPMAPYAGKEDSNKIVKSVTSRPTLLTQVDSDISGKLLEEDNDFAKSAGSIFREATSFLGEHGGDIMSLASFFL